MTDMNLMQLPSKVAYAEFNGEGSTYSASCSWLEYTRTALESALDECGKVKGYVDQIVKAWCIVQNSGGMRNLGSTHCFPFYYWLGNILFNQLRLESPLETMKTIYENLNEVLSKEKCTIIYDNIDQTTFGHMKAAYEYYQDHAKIEKQLNQLDKRCTAAYQQHLTNIVSAYKSINGNCVNDMTKPHCRDFNNSYKKHSPLGPPELTCTIESGQKSSEGSAHASVQLQTEEVNSSSGTIPTTAISSVFSVLGMGVAAASFFLYKIRQTIPLYMMDDDHEHLKEEERRMISLNRNKEGMWLITLHNASTAEKK
ncbi:Variable surface protein Vir7-like protein [Plasmodium coatneyi]|uniref:Variable surface protein Vir7-like protein n=1 Tax=Plasmodium coatneyi TaxID=208452 RepID=A0A1B1E464_9APIC|nr:Variable surface protein Vir7-like protein [Plasmodium coatneyi]ANQ09785.1 Variable surface protein Vir7-like protein [Plasmodium coatneyi]